MISMMMDKQQRQQVISGLVAAGAVGSQRDILDALEKDGLAVDQSTLSRDLNEMGVKKVSGRYRLVALDNGHADVAHYFDGVRRFTVCGPHQIVVFTESGLAQPVAVAIEKKKDPSILATLAGDDVLFVATKSRNTQAVALRRLGQWMGDDKYEK
ncbi:MAG: arginine repressor [Phycisphaerae bacterium]|nr:MAG: arginine repressor [Phycisphaerae bacterium]